MHLCLFHFLITDLPVLGCQLCPGWPNLNPRCYTSNQDVNSYCHANCCHFSAITFQVEKKSSGVCISHNYNTILDHASGYLCGYVCGCAAFSFAYCLCVNSFFFFSSSSFPYRSTKLVIIERLLLLAERYVITIEVGLEFSSECLICMAFSHTLLEECSLAHVIAHSWSFQTFFFPQPETSLPVSKCPQTPPYD